MSFYDTYSLNIPVLYNRDHIMLRSILSLPLLVFLPHLAGLLINLKSQFSLTCCPFTVTYFVYANSPPLQCEKEAMHTSAWVVRIRFVLGRRHEG